MKFDFKNGCKNEFENNDENHVAESKIGSPLKTDFRAEWTHDSNPTAWELIFFETNSTEYFRN